MADGPEPAVFQERPTAPVVPDAWAFALPLGAAGALVAWALSLWLGALLAGLGLFCVAFFRNPVRRYAGDPHDVVAPADGRVLAVDLVEDASGGKALRIGIFLSVFDVHVNRAPVAGVVEAVIARPGKCLPATGTECIDQNESTLLGLRTDAGLKVGVRQVTGALARTIVCGVSAGQRLARGERYGMIKLGSRTELLVPAEAGFVPAVQLGDVVRGGETVLGRLGAPAATGPGDDARAAEGMTS